MRKIISNTTAIITLLSISKLGREYATHFNLKLTGTIGVLLKAKERTLIYKIEPLLKAMKKNRI